MEMDEEIMFVKHKDIKLLKNITTTREITVHTVKEDGPHTSSEFRWQTDLEIASIKVYWAGNRGI